MPRKSDGAILYVRHVQTTACGAPFRLSVMYGRLSLVDVEVLVWHPQPRGFHQAQAAAIVHHPFRFQVPFQPVPVEKQKCRQDLVQGGGSHLLIHSQVGMEGIHFSAAHFPWVAHATKAEELAQTRRYAPARSAPLAVRLERQPPR